ncbi:MAG TPA: NADH-quinone oxidoreductase subunit A [Candidatus Thermoplasmatota archaeon]|nr:NADH-quinone oxidoreductase subunit A [Candidatus Thermoplasmatota archaeon]
MTTPLTGPIFEPPNGGINTASEALSYLPMAILGAVAFLLVFVTLLGNKFLGPKRGNVGKLASYECGEKATPGARGPIDVQYYMYILTFLVFDVEAMFLVPFALKFRTLGWGPIVAVGMFVTLILVGFLWEIKKKLLGWRALE